MHVSTPFIFARPLSGSARLVWPMVLGGGLAIAVADLIYCVLFWAPQGVAPMRLLQGVAAGALGKASFHAGWTSAMLGAGFMWLIGCTYVLAYAVMARHARFMQQHIHRCGIAYGLALYAVMNGIVVPLSAAPTPSHPNLAWILISIPMFGVFGVIAAVFARRSLR